MFGIYELTSNSTHDQRPSTWEFRLSDGSPFMGRLELRPNHTAEWGTVCSDGFGNVSALAACHSLGYKRHASKLNQVSWGWDGYDLHGRRGMFHQRLLPRELQLHVLHRGGHTKQLHALGGCRRGLPTQKGTNHTGSLRLRNGRTVWCLVQHPRTLVVWRCARAPSSHGGPCAMTTWRATPTLLLLCATHLTSARRHQKSSSGTEVVYLPPLSTWRTLCATRAPPYLQNCSYIFSTQAKKRHQCDHSEDVGVDCSPPPQTNPQSWELRLVGTQPNIGRLEMRPTPLSEWGTVCDDGFDSAAALAACHSLGYLNISFGMPIPFFGGGAGTIYLDRVTCNATTRGYLQNCSYVYSTPNDTRTACSHSEDVGNRLHRSPTQLQQPGHRLQRHSKCFHVQRNATSS